MKTCNVTIVGGSNTVMEPGYVSAMLAQARQRGMTLNIVENLAVGGTTCGCGLYRLKTSEAIERSDLLIIEYAINDDWIYGNERRQVRQWARFYEGIIRHALKRNPSLIVCSLVFGARNGTYLSAVPSIDAGMHYLSAWYRTDIVDVSSELMRRFGRDVVIDPGFYMDQGHYARPVATAMVADIVVDGVLAAIERGPRHVDLPPAVDPKNFADAGTVTAPTLAKMAGQPLVEYRNRLFDWRAFELGDMEVSFRLQGGKLLAILYACEAQTGLVAVTRNGTTTYCAMMRAGVAKGQFRFLTSMLSCDFLYGAQVLDGDDSGTYALTLHRGAEADSYVPKDSLAHGEQERQVLPILGFMHSGTLHDLQVRPSLTAVVETQQSAA